MHAIDPEASEILLAHSQKHAPEPVGVVVRRIVQYPPPPGWVRIGLYQISQTHRVWPPLTVTGWRRQVSADLGSQWSEVIAAQDVATIGALCSLASFTRPELRTKVIDNVNFREFLELVPEVRDYAC